jgi:hypothetical protein
VLDADTVTEEVRALERMDLQALRFIWAKHFGDPPRMRSPELLRLMLAWRMQAQAFGGLDAATRRRLRQGRRAASLRDDSLGQGARIVREWRGTDHVVETVDGGFRWNGKTYLSLSAVAFAITGVKRNGPAFFGLREKAGVGS